MLATHEEIIQMNHEHALEGPLFSSFRPPAVRELIVLMIASPTLGDTSRSFLRDR